MGLGNWALEIGPWKLDPGNWALENVPLECGVHANLYPCYLKPLVLHHLGIHCPWKKDALQHWCLAENPLEKGFLEFLPLEISVNPTVHLLHRPTAPLDLLFQNRKKVEKVHSNMM